MRPNSNYDINKHFNEKLYCTNPHQEPHSSHFVMEKS